MSVDLFPYLIVLRWFKPHWLSDIYIYILHYSFRLIMFPGSKYVINFEVVISLINF